MSEENTQNLPDTRSFEERVFARFDAIDAGLRDLNSRVERREAESERRGVETKPIWERALAEIVAVGQKVDALSEEVAVISRKVNVIESRTETFALDMFDLRVEQRELKKRMSRLDSENAR
jgi:chromosome segregation ATPase